MSTAGEVSSAKRDWRRKLLEQRDSITETTRSADNAALRSSVLEWVGRQGASTVCAYVPAGPEPGSLDLLDDLRQAGYRVLLPLVMKRSALEWAEYQGAESLQQATFGLLEPSGDRLGTEAIGLAQVVLVPALAVDRRGVRLGRGAGYYDRSLPKAAPEATLTGVVWDDELVDELPGEPHDVRIGSVLTPGRGVVALPM